MKEMNRREFLTLTGAAVVALSLAGCGGPSAPPAPAAPTGKEAKVLEALNLYRKENKLDTYQMDEGLNGLAEEAAKFALGDITLNQLYEKIGKMNELAGGPYEKPRFPLGVTETGELTMPYSEDIEVMKKALLVADIDDSIEPPDVKLVGIKVFTAKDGKLYWVATGANSKKTA